jgi:hypothetical protein
LSGGIPAQDLGFSTFQPTFLYELIWDLALAGFLIWLGHHAKIKLWGLFALYVAGYSAFRIFEESLRVDSSEHFLGLRFNMFVAIALTIIGLVWFVLAQLRPKRTYTVLPPGTPEEAGAVDARPDEAAAARETAAGADIAPEGTIVEGAAGKTTQARCRRQPQRSIPGRAKRTDLVKPPPVLTTEVPGRRSGGSEGASDLEL